METGRAPHNTIEPEARAMEKWEWQKTEEVHHKYANKSVHMWDGKKEWPHEWIEWMELIMNMNETEWNMNETSNPFSKVGWMKGVKTWKDEWNVPRNGHEWNTQFFCNVPGQILDGE